VVIELVLILFCAFLSVSTRMGKKGSLNRNSIVSHVSRRISIADVACSILDDPAIPWQIFTAQLFILFYLCLRTKPETIALGRTLGVNQGPLKRRSMRSHVQVFIIIVFRLKCNPRGKIWANQCDPGLVLYGQDNRNHFGL
jgi:hypothetical protein